MSMIERVARAIHKGRNGPGRTPWAHLPKSHQEPYLTDARAAIAAMKYSDGEDEDLLIQAAQQERMDPVGLSCAWDAMIDAARGRK